MDHRIERGIIHRQSGLGVRGLTAYWDIYGVHIRCCGNGCLWFRPYGELTFEKRQKVSKSALAPPLGASLRLGMPSLRHCSVGRRDGPSMAQRG